MGRTKQTQRKQSHTVSIPVDKHYCALCKQFISILRKGVEKHKNGRKHQRNMEIHQGNQQLDNEMDTSDAAMDVFDGASDYSGGEHANEQVTTPYLYGRELPQANLPPSRDRPLQNDEVEEEAELSHVVYVDSPPKAPLDPSKIYVQKHPYSRNRIPFRAPTAPSILASSAVRAPYWPFKSLIDFEQAELCIDYGLSKPKIDRHLKLAMKTQGGPQTGPFTLQGANDLFETLNKVVVFDEDKFTETMVKTTFKGKVYMHALHYRPLDAMIRELLRDPELEDFWVFDAERRYIAAANGSAMRVYEEYHQADDMWQIQNAMGPRTHPILLSLYADATQLSSFGCGKLWTFYLTLANLPCRIRNSRGKGGPALGGYLPEVDTPPGMPASQLGEFRCLVYHDCWRTILSSIETEARIGGFYQIGAGNQMHGTPIIAMKNTDYEEGCRMGCNIGRSGPCGCLICGVPSNSFDDFEHTYPDRDSRIATLAVEKSLSNIPNLNYIEIPWPHSLGIRSIKNAFDITTNLFFSNHLTFGFDDLHVFLSGAYGRTLIPDTLGFMHKAPYPEIDKVFGSLPRYPDLKHFKKGWCSLKWKSAEDWKVVAKLMTPVLYAVLPLQRHRRSEVVQLFRLFGECQVLLSFKMHTDATIEALRSVLERMATLQRELQEDLSLRLKTPKMHVLHNHTLDSIRQKGPIQNTSTSFGEACHPQSKQDYKITSKKTGVFEKTMLKIALRRFTMQKIRDLVDLAEEGDPPQMTISQQEPTTKFGSPGTRTTLGEFLQTLRIPDKFPQPDPEKLLRSMNSCLYHNCRSYTEHGSPHLKVIPQKFCRIPYVSLHNNDFLADKIRVTPNWYSNGPRHDFVVVNLDDESLSFAQVHALLILTHNDEQYQIALIRLLKTTKQSENAGAGSGLTTPKRSRITGYIHAGESSDYRFVSTKCFIRSVFVHLPTGNCSQYVINDLIDQDMYLRLAQADS